MLVNLLEMFAPRNDRDKLLGDLSAMANHELADLGISRDQIEAYVRTHAPSD